MPRPSARSRDRLRELLDVVEQSLDAPGERGPELAQRAYLSPFHFSRLVAAAVGEAPGALRRRVLLERAAHRLATTGDAVIDVALDAGYGSPEAFARAFTRAYGEPPSAFRRRGGVQHQLPAVRGVHFHPPGSIRLPGLDRSDTMDVLTRMYDHHLATTRAIVERTEGLADDVLDTPMLTVEGIDDPPTLRVTVARLVTQLEMWVSALEGGTTMPDATGAGTLELRRRLEVAGPKFKELVLGPIGEGRADDTFIDAMCEPAETFTYGGVLAHVLTFSAARRTLAIGALETAGVNDLGAGDPMRYVGDGPDASDAADITRRRSDD